MKTLRLHYAVLVAAFLLALPAQAQRFTGALKIGGAITTFTGEARPGTEFDLRTSLAGGVAFGYDFGNGFIVQPELLYLIKGAYFDAAIDGVPSRLRSDLTYLELPVLVIYRFELLNVQPKIFAGPSVATQLDARINFRAKGSDRPFDSNKDSSIDSYDYGAVVGAGVEFFIGSQRMSFDARALLGQANVLTSGRERHNTGVAFFLGVVF